MNNYQEQGIEVYVRIRPIPYDQQDQRRSVVLSQSEDNTIVVESNNKKEYFSFDYIASENTHQQQLFQRVGEPVVLETLKGYNCCVFSYGQTGAGKTYSILGNPTELVQDPFSDQRGLLPRILEQMFSRINNPCNGFQSVTVNCSYLQIYNEQIIDLMTKQSKNLPIRQDIRKGVYVDGLTQLPIKSYEDVLNIIIKGLAVRKTASTFMNSQSSRSHTIFTMMLNMQFQQQDIKKNLRSKIHIIDLAGSERTKLTKVEGERLKQGCNINKSLLTLSNVICSLADAGKKKKYIPFRDSKLTFFLKDSLGGNSKTKLLANISPKVAYFGDTISTLMFAKRAKIIKTKVQPNENIADNFESLRTQIRKLREELAQTKFIKPPQSTMRVMSPVRNKTQSSNLFLTKDNNFLPTQSFLEMSQYGGQFQQQFKIFMQNEMSYRLIIQNNFKIIQSNQKQVTNSGGNLKNLFEQKKRLQKTVAYQQKLLNNFPAFTKIFSQNTQLKIKLKQIQTILEEVIIQTKQKSVEIQTLQNTILILNAQIENLQDLHSHQRSKQQITPIHSRRQMNSPILGNSRVQSKRNSSSELERKIPQLKLGVVKRRRKTSLAFTHRNGFKDIVSRQNAIIDQYQGIIQDLKANFQQSIQNLRTSYHALQQLYQQQQRQKHQIRKNKRKQPQAQALSNQNQYLKLNIMQLETQIKKFQQQLFKKQVQVKTMKDDKLQLQFKLQNMQKLSHQNGIKQCQLQSLIQKIKIIKLQAQKAEYTMNQQMEKYCIEINELNYKLSKMIKQNYTLLSKNEALNQQNSIYKGKISELASIDQSIIQFKQGMECTTTLDTDEDFTFQKTLHQDIVKNLQKLTIQKQRLNRQIQENQKQKLDQKSKLQKASLMIRNLTQQLIFFKDQSTHYSQQAQTTLRQLEIIKKEKTKSEEKSKLFEIELSRLKKQIEKNENVSNYIKKQFMLQPLQFVQEARHLKERNSLLNQQNKRLRESIQQIENKNNLLKNSKSMSSLSTLPIQKPISSGLQKIIQQKQQKTISSVPISQRGDLTFRKKQQSKLANIPQKQKEKSSLQFKTKTFFGQQGKNTKKNK